jgi:hypothetical protein
MIQDGDLTVDSCFAVVASARAGVVAYKFVVERLGVELKPPVARSGLGTG